MFPSGETERLIHRYGMEVHDGNRYSEHRADEAGCFNFTVPIVAASQLTGATDQLILPLKKRTPYSIADGPIQQLENGR